MPLRILVVGTGALGSYFAATLGRCANAQVGIVGRWTNALDAVRERGLLLIENGKESTVPVQVFNHADPIDFRPDVALVLVKSYQTDDAASLLARLSDPAVVVTLQNGMGNLERLERARPAGSVRAGATNCGATLLGPGIVRGFPGAVCIEGVSGQDSTLTHLATLLSECGLTTTLTADIQPVLWKKLAANCAINPLTALHRVTNGALLESPELRAQLRASANEVAAVARAVGVLIESDLADEAEEVARKTAANRSSMLQDIERGRPTEIDSLCGFVVHTAAIKDVSVPVNQTFLRSIRALQRPLTIEETSA